MKDMEWRSVACGLLLAPIAAAVGQSDPLLGPIGLSVAESLVEHGPPIAFLRLATTGTYGCGSLTLATHEQFGRDSIVVTIDSLWPHELCTTMIGPATADSPLTLTPGTRVLVIERRNVADRLQLRVTDAELVVRQLNSLAFVRPDTTPFFRPVARTFLLSCGTPNIPKLCDDLREWSPDRPASSIFPFRRADASPFSDMSAMGTTITNSFDSQRATRLSR